MVGKKSMIVPPAIGCSIVDFVEKTQTRYLGWFEFTPMRVGKHNIMLRPGAKRSPHFDSETRGSWPCLRPEDLELPDQDTVQLFQG